MRRRPLLRAAAVGGTAYVAGKRRANRQAEEQAAYDEQDARISNLEQQQYGQQQQGYPPQQQAPPPAQPAASAGPASVSDQLSQLKDLHDQGMLTDEEFSAAKAKVLGI